MTVLEVALNEREVKATQRKAAALSQMMSTRSPTVKIEVDAKTLAHVLRFVTSASLRSAPAESIRQPPAVASGDEITPQEAAAILGMSRPSVMRLIQKGLLHPRKVMSRNKLSRAEVLAFQKANTREQRQALRNLSALSEEFEF